MLRACSGGLAPAKVTLLEAMEAKIAPFRAAHDRGWTIGYVNRTGGCVRACAQGGECAHNDDVVAAAQVQSEPARDIMA